MMRAGALLQTGFPSVMMHIWLLLITVYDQVNVYPASSFSHKKNICLGFAGNAELTSSTSLIGFPPEEAGQFLKKDEIRAGQARLFPGSSDYKQVGPLFFLTICTVL